LFTNAQFFKINNKCGLTIYIIIEYILPNYPNIHTKNCLESGVYIWRIL
jgi:hypothetical protein